MTVDTLTADLAATIEATRRAEREIFGGLDEPTLHRSIRPGDWNPKDFQAHLTAWKSRQADRYAALREGRELPPATKEEDEINAEYRAARVAWPWPDIVAEANEVSDRLVEEIRAADPTALRATERIIGGTFGNGILHALTHFRWLLEAGVPVDARRVDAFADETVPLVSASSLPASDRAIGAYDLACFLALTGRTDDARARLRDAFRLDPDLVDFARTDADLASLHGELDALT